MPNFYSVNSFWSYTEFFPMLISKCIDSKKNELTGKVSSCNDFLVWDHTCVDILDLCRPPPTLSLNDPRLRFSQEFFKVNFLPVWRNAIFIATTSDSIWTLFFLANKQIAKCVAFLPGNSWFYFVCLLSSMISVWWLTHFETCWNNPEFVWIHTYVR